MPQAQRFPQLNGLLILPLVYMIFALLGATLMIVLLSMTLLVQGDSEWLLTGVLSLLNAVIMWGFTLWVIVLFFKQSRRFVKAFIIWLMVMVLLAVKSFMFSPISDQLALYYLGITLLPTALFVPYIKRSEYAKAVFTRP